MCKLVFFIKKISESYAAFYYLALTTTVIGDQLFNKFLTKFCTNYTCKSTRKKRNNNENSNLLSKGHNRAHARAYYQRLIPLYWLGDLNFPRARDATQVSQHTGPGYALYICCVILRTVSRNQCRESRFQSDGSARIHMSRREIKSSAREATVRELRAARILPGVRRARSSTVAAAAACDVVVIVIIASVVSVAVVSLLLSIQCVSVRARWVKMAWTDRALLRLSSLVVGFIVRRDGVHATSVVASSVVRVRALCTPSFTFHVHICVFRAVSYMNYEDGMPAGGNSRIRAYPARMSERQQLALLMQMTSQEMVSGERKSGGRVNKHSSSAHSASVMRGAKRAHGGRAALPLCDRARFSRAIRSHRWHVSGWVCRLINCNAGSSRFTEMSCRATNADSSELLLSSS